MLTKLEIACKEYAENQKLIKEIETMQDALKKDILKLMRGRDKVDMTGYTCSRSTYTGSRFDRKKFDADYPNVYTLYTVPTTQTTRLTVKAK